MRAANMTLISVLKNCANEFYTLLCTSHACIFNTIGEVHWGKGFSLVLYSHEVMTVSNGLLRVEPLYLGIRGILKRFGTYYPLWMGPAVKFWELVYYIFAYSIKNINILFISYKNGNGNAIIGIDSLVRIDSVALIIRA